MGPQSGFLPGSIQRLHGTMLELTPGMQSAGALPARAPTRLTGARVAAEGSGRVSRG